MVIKNLQFFDYNGYNLNFEFNDNAGYWEGTIYLPKVSVGLYANTSIYILENIPGAGDSNIFSNSFFFPTGSGKIVFRWDSLNKFVDEFFMFNFDETYTIKETSALVYTPNDGPDCNTLIVNRFDEYEIPLSDGLIQKALPIHIAFMAHERYDATTYNRTLLMYYNNNIIAKIKFYAETVEEDERLKIWNHNLGYKITPEDTMIFYKSDIKEYMPDYMLLNEKRKELMMEGSNIYPYIGSYKAIINAIKFFGYENLNIIEYWRNVNPDDENFGKIYHSSKYSLTHKETLRIGARNIVLPNKDYKKINALALVYSINKPTGEVDEWYDLPKVKEQFTYTIEEAIIKLFALRKKLNKEFMPGTSRIIDIIGEANYFGLQGILKLSDFSYIEQPDRILKLDFNVEPSKYVHITDNEYFNRYINIIKNGALENVPIKNQLLSDIGTMSIPEILSQRPRLTNPQQTIYGLLNNERCDYYREYYREAFVDYTIFKAIENNDDYSFENEEYDYYNSEHPRFSAKVILKCDMFSDTTFENCELKFDCKKTAITSNKQNPIQDNGTYDVTFDNINDFNNPDKISWSIKMSDPDDETGQYQIDDDAKDIGIIRKYQPKSWYKNLGNENMDQFGQWFVELPYVGYYDVTMTINGQKKTKKKCIKVEPYNIDVIGFYYDARELPKKINYENPEDSVMYNFIQENLTNMTGWATSERTNITEPTDFSMPTYTYLGEMINTGPYYNENVEDEWYLADNLTYEMSKLKPIVKYARYIKSGVDVKPYTWFLLGYEYSKIAGKVNPVWTITNNTEGGSPRTFEGRFLTMLLKKEGNYTVTLKLEDKNGNIYETSRNIIVVSKSANYKLYQPFKKEYDYMIEQNMIRELNDIYYNYNEEEENGEEPTPTPTPTPTPSEPVNQNISFSSNTVNGYYGTPFVPPTLSGAHTSLTYTSSNTSVATVNRTTGVVTLKPVNGSTRITVTAAATSEYNSATASYTITVNRLPQDYQEEEYISSGGTKYIKTGVTFNQSSRIVMRYKTNATNGSGYLFGSMTSNASNASITGEDMFVVNVATTGYFKYGSIRESTSLLSNINEHTIDFNGNTVSLDGNVVHTFEPETFTCPDEMYLLWANCPTSQSFAVAKAYIYSCQMYADGIALNRDYVPCTKISTSESGLYDLVSKTFFPLIEY